MNALIQLAHVADLLRYLLEMPLIFDATLMPPLTLRFDVAPADYAPFRDAIHWLFSSMPAIHRPLTRVPRLCISSVSHILLISFLYFLLLPPTPLRRRLIRRHYATSIARRCAHAAAATPLMSISPRRLPPAMPISLSID